MLDLGDQRRSLVGAAAEYGASGLALLGGLVGTAQRLAVLAHGVVLLLDTPTILRQDDALVDRLQLAL
ncbi:hypothetical protein D3C81_1138560 [compost metagenome]